MEKPPLVIILCKKYLILLNLSLPSFHLMRCGQATEQRGGISIIYSSLAHSDLKLTYMTLWETELREDWDLNTWHTAFFRSYKGILNTSLSEACLKVITRWYMTPYRLSRIFPSASPLCFRGCHLVGTMSHIWWDCPRIRDFWNKVFSYDL